MDSSCDWREGLRSVVEQQLYMLEHGTLSDCTFILAPDGGETREFRLHRHVLARCSEVFEAMLLPPGERMQEALTGRVTITDIQTHIFHIALKFIYTGDASALCDLHVDAVLGVSGVADKYRVLLLRAACEQRLCELLDPSCVWRLLGLSQTLQGYGELQEKCVQLLQCDTPACLSSPDFTHATEESLVLLLQQDQLHVDSELPLIAAAVRWACLESGRRAASGSKPSVRAVLEPRLLPLLRLLSLSAEQLMLLCGLTETWLSESEREALSARDLAALPHSFCTDPRQRAVEKMSKKLCFLDRRDQNKTEEVRSQEWTSAVLVEVSSAVWLKEISYEKITYSTGEHHRKATTFTISISTCSMINGTTPGLCNTKSYEFTLVNFVEQNGFFLPDPYRLMVDRTYCIEITSKPQVLGGTMEFRQQKHMDSVQLFPDHAVFTFNRRDSGFESLIKGPDILLGLMYSRVL